MKEVSKRELFRKENESVGEFLLVGPMESGKDISYYLDKMVKAGLKVEMYAWMKFSKPKVGRNQQYGSIGGTMWIRYSGNSMSGCEATL